MDLLRQDLQHSARMLRRQPGPAAVVVLTLAVGLGLNAAVFTQLRSTLLRPLQYLQPDRLVMIWTTVPAQGVEQTTSAFGNIEDWRSRTRAFGDIATFDQTTLTLTGGEWAERTAAVRASSNLFAVQGGGGLFRLPSSRRMYFARGLHDAHHGSI